MTQLTYRELRDLLTTLTEDQLAMPATVYAGDIDEAMPVFSTCVNTDEVMGLSLEGYSKDQLFLQV